MKIKYLLFLLISIFFLNANGQNYKSVVSGDTVYYASKGYFWPYSNTLRTVYIASAANAGPDSTFHFYTAVRPDINTFMCLDTSGPSWLGKNFVRDNAGNEKYMNAYSEEIAIKTLSNLNDTWKIITDSNNVEIWGIVSQLDTMTIDNQLDSIKTISLQAYVNMVPQNHGYNNRQIILSKNHGFVSTLDFFIFPYGMTFNNTINSEDSGTFYRIDRKYTERTLNEINFTKKYQPGNYWQYVDSFHTNDNTTFFTRLDYKQDSVISHTMLNPNCAIVDFYTITNRSDHEFVAPNNHTYHDTVLYTYHTDTICNAAKFVVLRDSIYPETKHNDSIWLAFPVVPYYYFTTMGDSLAMFSSYYYSYNTYAFDPQWNCIIQYPTVSGQKFIYWQFLEGFGIFKKDIFIGNQGGGYINEDRHFYHYFFKLGNDTFGTALNLKVLSVDEISASEDISIFPNPTSNGLFYIKSNEAVSWEIYSIDGKLFVSGSHQNIDLSNGYQGIYLMKIKVHDKVYHKKILNKL